MGEERCLLAAWDASRGAADERAVDRFGGVAAVGDGDDGEILAAGDAIAAGPDAGQRGAALVVDLDAAALQRDAGDGAVQRLADRRSGRSP